MAWHGQYGPIYGFKLFGLDFVSLGTVEAANDLLRNRGNIYSDRHYIATLRDAIHLPAVAYGGMRVFLPNALQLHALLTHVFDIQIAGVANASSSTSPN